jgi:hypothetical protein
LLTSTLDGGEWSDSRTCLFTPGERARGTNCIWSLVDPRVDFDVVEKGIFFAPAENGTAVQPVAIPTELLQLHTNNCYLLKKSFVLRS